MKQMSVEQVAQDFRAVLSQVEQEQEEVVVVRNLRNVARIVPDSEGQTALEVFSDLCGSLDRAAAEAWWNAIRSVRSGGTLGELRQSWGT